MNSGMRHSYNILVGKPKGKRPFGRSKHRWEDRIEMDLTEVGPEKVDWIQMAQDEPSRL
jgi:hypothetical protein